MMCTEAESGRGGMMHRRWLSLLVLCSCCCVCVCVCVFCVCVCQYISKCVVGGVCYVLLLVLLLLCVRVCVVVFGAFHGPGAAGDP